MTSYYNDNNNNTSQDNLFASSNGFFKSKEAESTVNFKKRDIKFTDFPTNNINSTDRHKKFDDIKFKQGALTKFVSNLNQSCYIKNQYDANEMSMLTPDERDKTFLFKNKRNLTSLSNLMSHLNNNHINNLYNNNNNVSQDNIDTINNNYTYVKDINIDDDVNNNKVISSNNLPITQILDFETKGVLERVMYIQRAYKRRYLILNYTAEFIQSNYRAFKARKKVKKAFSDLSLFRNGLNRLSRVLCPKYFTKFFMRLSNYKSKLFVVRYVIKIQKIYKTRLLIKKLKEEQIKRVVKEKAFIIKNKTYSKNTKKINSINDNKTLLIQKTFNSYLIRKYKAMLVEEKENRLKAEKIINEEKDKPRVINKMKLNNKVDIKNNNKQNNENIERINTINKSNIYDEEADNIINANIEYNKDINNDKKSNVSEVKDGNNTSTNNTNNKVLSLTLTAEDINNNNADIINNNENIINVIKDININKENIIELSKESITDRIVLVPKIPDTNDSLYKDSNWFKKDYFHNEFSIYKKNKYNNKNNKKLLSSIKKIKTAYKKYSESKYRVVKISKEAYERLNKLNQKQTAIDKKNNEKENNNDIIAYNTETSKSLKIENKDSTIISNNNKAHNNNNDNLFDNYIKQNFIRKKIVINEKREICNSIILKTSNYSTQKKKDLMYKVNYMIVYIMSTLFPEKLIKKYKEKIELKSKSKLKLEKPCLKISQNKEYYTDNCNDVSNIKIDGKNPEDTLTLNNHNNADSTSNQEQQNSINTNKENRINKENSNKKNNIDEDLNNDNENECNFDLQSQIIKNLIKKNVITNPEIKELSNSMVISSLDINHINPELVVKNIIENNILNASSNLNKLENLDFLIKKINRNSTNLKVVSKPFYLQKISILNKQKKQSMFVKKITSLLAKNAGYESINANTNFNNKNSHIGNNEENTNTITIKEINFEESRENRIINKNELCIKHNNNKENSNIDNVNYKNKHTTNNKYIKKQVYIRNKKIPGDFSNSLFIKNIRSLKYDKDIILIQRQLFGIKEDIYSNKENPISNEMLEAKETNKLRNKSNDENDNGNSIININNENKEEKLIKSNDKVQNSTIKQRNINIRKLFKPALIESNNNNYHSYNISNNIKSIQSILPNYNQSSKNSKTSKLRINSIPKLYLNKLIKLQRLIKVKMIKNRNDKQELAKIRTKPRFNIMDLIENEDKQGGFEINKDNSVLVRENNEDKAQNTTGLNKLYNTISTKSSSFYNSSVFYKSITDNSLMNKIKSIQKLYNRDFAYKCYVLDNLPADRINQDKSKNYDYIKKEIDRNTANDVYDKIKQEDNENNDTADPKVNKDAESLISKNKINEIKEVKKEFRFKPLLLNKADFVIKNSVLYNKKNYLTNNFAIKQAKRISKFISENRYINTIQQVQQIKQTQKNIFLIEERQQVNKEEIVINKADNIERIDNDNDNIKPTEIENVNNKINCDYDKNNIKSDNEVDKCLDQECDIVKSTSNNNIYNIDNKAFINDNEVIMIKKRFKISKNEIIERLKIKTDFIKDNKNHDDLIKQASLFDGFVNTKVNKLQKPNTKMNQSVIKITQLLKQFYLSTNSANNKTNISKISKLLKETKLKTKSKDEFDITHTKQKDDLINEEEIIKKENKENVTSTKEIILDDNLRDIHNEEVIINKKFLIKNKEIQEAFKLNNTLNHKNLIYLLKRVRSNNNNDNSLVTTNNTSFVKKQSSLLFLNKKVFKIQTYFKKYINKKIKEEESRGIIKKAIIRKNDIVNAMKNSHLAKENIADISKYYKTKDKNNDIENKENELNLENKDLDKYFETIKTSNTNNIFTKNQDLEKRCRLDDAFNKDIKENHITYQDNSYSEYYFNNLKIIKDIKLKRDFVNVKANKIISLFRKHSKSYKLKDIIIKREAINTKTLKESDIDRLSKSLILWKKYNSLLYNSNKLKDLLIRLNINSINRILKQELISKLKQIKTKMTYLLEKSDKKNEVIDLKNKLLLWWKINKVSSLLSLFHFCN